MSVENFWKGPFNKINISITKTETDKRERVCEKEKKMEEKRINDKEVKGIRPKKQYIVGSYLNRIW